MTLGRLWVSLGARRQHEHAGDEREAAHGEVALVVGPAWLGLVALHEDDVRHACLSGIREVGHGVVADHHGVLDRETQRLHELAEEPGAALASGIHL